MHRIRVLFYSLQQASFAITPYRSTAILSARMADTTQVGAGARALSIGTHDGKFHCDEALACFILKELPRFAGAQIVRTRDAKLLANCDILVDVGGEYDPARLRFDHHQSTFKHTMRSLDEARFRKTAAVKLSSAGLIWYHFGNELIERVLEHLDSYRKRFSGAPRNYAAEFATSSKPRTEQIFQRVYDTFMLELDAIDNGVSACDCAETEVRYRVSTGLCSRVDHLNSTWNEEASVELQNSRFAEAMQLAGADLVNRIIGLVDVWWPSRAIVEEAYAKRFEVDASGVILQLTRGGCPWKEHLTTLEEENERSEPVLFVTYPEDSRVQDGARRNWRVQAVSVAAGSFESRLPLASAWRGLRDAELSAASEIPDCVFVHTSGFIGGNRSAEGALEMARRTIAIDRAQKSGEDDAKNLKKRTNEETDQLPQAKRGQLN